MVEIEKNKRINRSTKWLWLASVVGVMGYMPFIPYWLMLPCLLFPFVVFCWALTGMEQRFNFTFFAMFMMVQLLLMSTLFTLDSTHRQSYDTGAQKTAKMIDSLVVAINVVLMVIIVGVAAIMVLSAIWAMYIGQSEEGRKTLARAIMFIFAVVVFSLMLSMAGVPVFGIEGSAEDMYDTMTGTVQELLIVLETLDPIGLFEGEGGGKDIDDVIDGKTTGWGGIAMKDLKGIGLDARNPNPTRTVYVVAAIFPMVIAIMCFWLGVIFLSKRARELTVEFFDKLEPEEPKIEFKILNADWTLVFFVLLIGFASFMLFLNYARVYQETGNLNINQFGYFSVYLFLITISVMLMLMDRFTIYTKSNVRNTVYGSIVGLFILVLSFQYVSGTEQTYDAYKIEIASDANIMRVINTFVFVAPAETLFFHCAVPAAFLAYLYHRVEKKMEKNLDEGTIAKRERLEREIKILNLLKEVHSKDSNELKKVAVVLEQKERQLRNLVPRIEIGKDFVLEDRTTLLYYIVFIIIVNIGFSCAHWVLSDVDFITFWASGLGVIYLTGGVIITVIAWRFGWLAAIIAHALNNSLIYLLIMITEGVI